MTREPRPQRGHVNTVVVLAAVVAWSALRARTTLPCLPSSLSLLNQQSHATVAAGGDPEIEDHLRHAALSMTAIWQLDHQQRKLFPVEVTMSPSPPVPLSWAAGEFFS